MEVIIKLCPILDMNCAIENCNRFGICEVLDNIHKFKGYIMSRVIYSNHEDSIGE